ncbi:MAG: single-stranded DNA-binding protein [Chloroflexi bacterium HGW-Chloroflexi-10]|nr:MAG: single-stranded DNA-binding protein [Chloroflexi bacterium HGW-Chloroflexi-10]
MMYQKVTIVGNLGRDPEMRYTPSGQAVTSFPVATNRVYTGSDGQKVKETTWFRISAWGKQAENCNNYLHKGSKVLVEGRLVPDPQTGAPRIFTRQDGTTGSSFELSAIDIKFMDSKSDSESGPAGEETGGGEEDIPF